MKDPQEPRFTPPRATGDTAEVRFTPTRRPAATVVEEIKRRHEAALLGIAGVEGVGLSAEDGVEGIVVYLRDAQVRALVPATLENIPVRAVVTGSIEARRAPGTS